MKLIIISGRSGSGKTIALHVLEDLGYNCIDGVPFQLLEQLIDSVDPINNKIAITLDIRNLPSSAQDIEQLLATLKAKVEIEILYIDAISTELIRRYSETRRLHPLSKQKLSLSQALELESELLAPIKQSAALEIDTTTLSIHNLNERLKIYLQGSSKSNLLIIFQSFGFKYIHPEDADYIFDVRFLPNPHWEAELQQYNGQEQPIIDYLESFPVVEQTANQIENLFQSWLPHLENNNRNYVTIAIGCTGGKHRSVYLTEKIASRFKSKYQVQIEHKCLRVK
ncbi:RNase adapter RapZ [Psychromonas sp. Urea-02u-13]|uniref:RNase adapter RapZ n=1 Tax=Psychromonas sp. Urea-02u-13 TaxID=2058326 RepID=UPI000C349C58|nr:RNase adapter RapZ [Psychromonas sp. Urea-02u-13]PKG38557.1 RNase adapter RapZ [Psychromonas sp. Urea-02u-13]